MSKRYLFRVDVPDAIWTVRVQTPRPLPVSWDAMPEGMVSRGIGSTWLKSGALPMTMLAGALVFPGGASLPVCWGSPRLSDELDFFFRVPGGAGGASMDSMSLAEMDSALTDGMKALERAVQGARWTT